MSTSTPRPESPEPRPGGEHDPARNPGGLNEEVGNLDPADADEEDPDDGHLPGHMGGGLAGG